MQHALHDRLKILVIIEYMFQIQGVGHSVLSIFFSLVRTSYPDFLEPWRIEDGDGFG